MVNIYGVERKLLRALQSLYDDSRMCMRVGKRESDMSPKWVWQGCVRSPWLFVIYMDVVVREVHVYS